MIRRRLFLFSLPIFFLTLMVPFIIVMLYSKMGIINTEISVQRGEENRMWNNFSIFLFQITINFPFFYLIPMFETSHMFPLLYFNYSFVSVLVLFSFCGFLLSVGSLFYSIWVFTPFLLLLICVSPLFVNHVLKPFIISIEKLISKLPSFIKYSFGLVVRILFKRLIVKKKKNFLFHFILFFFSFLF